MPWDWLCSPAWILSSLKPLDKRNNTPNLVAYSDLISVPFKIAPKTLGWPAFSSFSLAHECASRKESGCSKPKSKPHFPFCLRSIAFVPWHWLGGCLQEELCETTASRIMQNCLTFFCKTPCSTEGDVLAGLLRRRKDIGNSQGNSHGWAQESARLELLLRVVGKGGLEVSRVPGVSFRNEEHKFLIFFSEWMNENLALN